jgi:hypothetical protein
MLPLMSPTFLFLKQAVVQPLQVTRLTGHYAVKRTLRKMRGLERNH